ncbi:MAG: hypothetical protein O3A14_20710, partial [Cyanobacteria bacterium]|nr:hypothetical protein [Cyanobacteriota bacterium]
MQFAADRTSMGISLDLKGLPEPIGISTLDPSPWCAAHITHYNGKHDGSRTDSDLSGEIAPSITLT